MARSTAEIQADIAVTRRLIETQLDGLRRRLPQRWWTPYAMLAGALVAGVVISRIPMLTVVKTGARAVQTGLAVASTVAAVDRFLAERPAAVRKAA
jgi:hypothetical protein